MRLLGLAPKAFLYVLGFTGIEVVTLAVWLILANKGYFVTSVVELFAGLFLEHLVAELSGRVNKF